MNELSFSFIEREKNYINYFREMKQKGDKILTFYNNEKYILSNNQIIYTIKHFEVIYIKYSNKNYS